MGLNLLAAIQKAQIVYMFLKLFHLEGTEKII